MTNEPSLGELARDNEFGRFRRALDRLAKGDGDTELTNFVQDKRIPPEYRTLAVAAVGRMKSGSFGPSGVLAALLAADPTEEDLICSAVVALVRRTGTELTHVYEDLLNSESPMVRQYALGALFVVATGSQVDRIIADLCSNLLVGARRFRVGFEPSVMYVLRFADADEIRRTVECLRRGWQSLTEDERGWLRHEWPGASIDGPAVESVTAPQVTANWFSWILDDDVRGHN